MWWNNYVGAEFDEKGRGPEVFDCWGLLQFVYANDHPKKHILPSYIECYESTNDRAALAKVIEGEKQNRWREVDVPQEFDAILLRMRGVPMHVGLVTKKGHMLHCAQGIGTVHERFDSIRWRDKILGFYRYE